MKEIKIMSNENFFPKNFKELEKNEKINRLIRNLYAHGSSEYTDYENAVKEMEKVVLSAPKEMQKEKYHELSMKMYHEDFERDNRTIFRIGIPGELELFRAFDIYESDSKEWIKLIDFYFEQKNIKEITLDLIEALTLCRLDKRKVYLHILKKFNDLQIVGNLNKYESYNDFLKKYLSAFSRLGFINTPDMYLLDGQPEDGASRAESVFLSLSNKLRNLQKKSPIQQMRGDIDLMIRFLEKNRELVGTLKEFEAPDRKVKIETKIKEDDSEVEKFLSTHDMAALSQDDVYKELSQKYDDESYSPVDVMDILKKISGT